MEREGQDALYMNLAILLESKRNTHQLQSLACLHLALRGESPKEASLFRGLQRDILYQEERSVPANASAVMRCGWVLDWQARSSGHLRRNWKKLPQISVMNNFLQAPGGLRGSGETQAFQLMRNRSFPSLISTMCCTQSKKQQLKSMHSPSQAERF